MTIITDLPLELIASVAQHAATTGDILSLMLTTKRWASPLLQDLLYTPAASYPAEKWCRLAAGTIYTNNLLAFKQLISHSSALLESTKSSTHTSIFHFKFHDERLSEIHAKYAPRGPSCGPSEINNEARLATLLAFLYDNLSNVEEMIRYALDAGMSFGDYIHFASTKLDASTKDFLCIFPLAVARDDATTVKLFNLVVERDTDWTGWFHWNFVANRDELMKMAIWRNYVKFARSLYERYPDAIQLNTGYRIFYYGYEGYEEDEEEEEEEDEEEEEGEEEGEGEGEEEGEEGENQTVAVVKDWRKEAEAQAQAEREKWGEWWEDEWNEMLELQENGSRFPAVEEFDFWTDSPDHEYCLHMAVASGSIDTLEFLLSLKTPSRAILQTCYESNACRSTSQCLEILVQHGARYTVGSMHTRSRRCSNASGDKWSGIFRNALLAWQPFSPELRRDVISIAAKSEAFAKMLVETLPDIFDGELPDDMNVLDAIYYVGLDNRQHPHRTLPRIPEAPANILLEKAGSHLTDSKKPPTIWAMRQAARLGHTMVLTKCLNRAYSAAENAEDAKKVGWSKHELIHLLSRNPWACADVSRCVRVLIQEGCDPEYRDANGYNAVLVACKNDNLRPLETLSKIPGVDFNINVEEYAGGYRAVEYQAEDGQYKPLDTAVGLIAEKLRENRANAAPCLESILKAGAIVPDRAVIGFESLLHEVVCGKNDLPDNIFGQRNLTLGASYLAGARPELAHQVVQCQKPCLGGNAINCIVAKITFPQRDDSKFLLFVGCTLLKVRDLCYSDAIREDDFDNVKSEKQWLLKLLAKFVFDHKVSCAVKDSNGDTPLDVVRSTLRRYSFDYDWDQLQARLEANSRGESPIAGHEIVSAWMVEEMERKKRPRDTSDIEDRVSTLKQKVLSISRGRV